MFYFALFVFAFSAVSNGYCDCRPGAYLVTMEKEELLKIVECISKSEDTLICKKFAVCEKLMAPRIQLALEECKKELVSEGVENCAPSSVVFDTPEVPEKIFDYAAEKIEKLTFPEKKIMLNFEECAKILAEDYCEKKEDSKAEKERLLFIE